MLVILVSFAFGFGLALARLGLPPMVGFLVAGFAFKMAGLAQPSGLDLVADLGITLLLFSIGLKLDVRGLLKAEIWASTTAQMFVTTALMWGAATLCHKLCGTQKFLLPDVRGVGMPDTVESPSFQLSSVVPEDFPVLVDVHSPEPHHALRSP
jgi:Kef-type K+ transport system membrane component KefB